MHQCNLLTLAHYDSLWLTLVSFPNPLALESEVENLSRLTLALSGSLRRSSAHNFLARLSTHGHSLSRPGDTMTVEVSIVWELCFLDK